MSLLYRKLTKKSIFAALIAVMGLALMTVSSAEARRAVVTSPPLSSSEAYQVLTQLAVYQTVSSAEAATNVRPVLKSIRITVQADAKAISRGDRTLTGTYIFKGRDLTCRYAVEKVLGAPLPSSVLCTDN